MKISVVTPCFNAETHVESCVQSVRYALDGFDYEHVIADGGSTDSTLNLLEDMGDDGGRLLVHSEPDSGMYDALNKAIERAQGDVIGHLNTDEQYNRKGIYQALDKFSDSSVDSVFSPTVMVDEAMRFLQLFKQVVTPRVIDTHWCMPVQSCSLLYRKACWMRIQYDTHYRLSADHVWFRAQMEAGMRIVPSPEPIGIFTWHTSNLSSTVGLDSSEDALADINKQSIRIQFAKHWYRAKKLLLGGYSKEPLEYRIFIDGKFVKRSESRPVLKVPKNVLYNRS